MRAGVLAILTIAIAGLGAGCGGNAALRSASLDLDRGEDQRAFERVDAELREHPNDDSVLRLYARAAVRVGRDDEALRALEKAEAKGKKEAARAATMRRTIWRDLFVPVQAVLDTLDRASDTDRRLATDLLSRAERVDPASAGTYAARATLMLHEGEPEGTIELFARAVALAREDSRQKGAVVAALVRGAEENASGGRQAEAVALARDAVSLAPDDVRAQYQLGVSLHRLGEATGDRAAFEEAGARFATILEKLPTDAEALYNFALAHYRLGDRDVAERAAREAIAVTPWQAPALELLARIRLEAGDRAGATLTITAARAARGTSVPVPRSVLDLSGQVGREGRKRFVLDGPPARIQRYVEKSGSTIEVWFHRDPSRIASFSDGRLIGEDTFEHTTEPIVAAGPPTSEVAP